MDLQAALSLKMHCPVKAQNAGLFISRGNDTKHPTRVINSHELILVKQGELDMWEEEQDFHLEPGQTLHLWPGRQHGSHKIMPPDLKFYWIHFEIEAAGNDDFASHGAEPFSSVINVPQVAHLCQPERLERLFRLFLDEQETGMLHPLSANMLTLLMLMELTEHFKASEDNLNVVATWAHTYIHVNFDRPITSSKVAASLGYNTDYLGRIYRQTYGCTLTEAIHRRRVHKACDYLLDSNLTISYIAHRCGFSDTDYFRRIFKRVTQITPSEYRDENSRLHVNTH